MSKANERDSHHHYHHHDEEAAPAPAPTPRAPPTEVASGGYSVLRVFFVLFVAGSAIPAVVTSGVSTDNFQIWIVADGCHALSAPEFGTSLQSLCYATGSVGVFPDDPLSMRCVSCTCVSSNGLLLSEWRSLDAVLVCACHS